MVSSLRYNSFKGGRGPKADRVPFFALLIAVAVIIALVIAPAETLLAAGTLYALSGPVMWLRRRKLPPEDDAEPRSEEHTSELQSLMRISYAVFCLKKKNKNNKNTHYYRHYSM